MKKLLLIFAAMAFLAVGCTPDFERYWESNLNAELPEIGDGDVNDDEDGNGNEGGEGGAYDYFTGKQWICQVDEEALLFDFGLTSPDNLIFAERVDGDFYMFAYGAYEVEEFSDTEGYIYVEDAGGVGADAYYYVRFSETEFAIIVDEYEALYFVRVDDPYEIVLDGTPKPEAKAERNLVFSATSVEATLGETFKAPTLSGEKTGVVYSSSNTGVATVNSTTGAVTLVAAGQTIITAYAAETETFLEGTASYVLTVSAADEEVTETISGTFTYNTTSKTLSLTTASGITITQKVASGSTAVNSDYNTATTLRVYKGHALTFSGKTITKIKLTHASDRAGDSVTASVGEYTAGSTSSVWIGEATQVVITNTGAESNVQLRPTKIEVTYKK